MNGMSITSSSHSSVRERLFRLRKIFPILPDSADCLVVLEEDEDPVVAVKSSFALSELAWEMPEIMAFPRVNMSSWKSRRSEDALWFGLLLGCPDFRFSLMTAVRCFWVNFPNSSLLYQRPSTVRPSMVSDRMLPSLLRVGLGFVGLPLLWSRPAAETFLSNADLSCLRR